MCLETQAERENDSLHLLNSDGQELRRKSEKTMVWNKFEIYGLKKGGGHSEIVG